MRTSGLHVCVLVVASGLCRVKVHCGSELKYSTSRDQRLISRSLDAPEVVGPAMSHRAHGRRGMIDRVVYLQVCCWRTRKNGKAVTSKLPYRSRYMIRRHGTYVKSDRNLLLMLESRRHFH